MPIIDIETVPFTITEPGEYRLTQSVTTDGDGITILSDNVTIDLNGYTISGPTDADTESFGISSFGHENITVKNGAVDGFMYAVYLSDVVSSANSTADLTTTNHVVEDLTITNATFRGIRVEGNDNVVQENNISNIGGTTVYENAYAFGIENFGSSEILYNTIHEVRGFGDADIGEGVGISLSYYVDNAVVRGNVISNSSAEVDGSYGDWPAESRSTWGIWVGGDTTGVIMDENSVDNFAYGITFKRTAFGILTDNTVSGAITPIYLPCLTPQCVIDRDGWDGGGNTGNLADDELISRRNTPGNVEFVEQVYLSPLHRPDEINVFNPIHDPTDGDDAIVGTAGDDMVDYWAAGAGVTVNLGAGTATGSGNDSLMSIEGAQGSFYADTITGSNGNNLLAGAEGHDVLHGGDGSDFLFGDEGNDQLFGDAGTDHLYGGEGADALDGGAGFDYARYDDGRSLGIAVSLDDPSMNTGVAVGDSYTDIEGLYLTRGDDIGYGDAGDNRLWGRDGHDALYGNGGKDFLYGENGDDMLHGGDGSDMLFGGAGADHHDGGDGFDYARYNDAGHGDIYVSLGAPVLNSNIAAGDTYSSIEGLILGRGNDRAYGDAGDNYLYGMQGNDMLFGALGADTLNGGEGFDYARYNDANYDGFFVSMTDPTFGTGVAAGDVMINIEGLILGANDDTGIGDDANNYLYGMQGNDTLSGVGGDDVLTGGAGDDRFVFATDFGNDKIRDFTSNEIVELSVGTDFDTFAEVFAVSSQQGTDTIIDFGNGDTLTFENFVRDNLTDDDFSFV